MRATYPPKAARAPHGHISSGGVYFRTKGGDAPANDMRIELAIHWPVLLHGSCPMKLMIYGWVESSHRHGAVVSLERYEFRTRGKV